MHPIAIINRPNGILIGTVEDRSGDRVTLRHAVYIPNPSNPLIDTITIVSCDDITVLDEPDGETAGLLASYEKLRQLHLSEKEIPQSSRQPSEPVKVSQHRTGSRPQKCKKYLKYAFIALFSFAVSFLFSLLLRLLLS